MPNETESAAREANIADANDVDSTTTLPRRKLATMSDAVADAGEEELRGTPKTVIEDNFTTLSWGDVFLSPAILFLKSPVSEESAATS